VAAALGKRTRIVTLILEIKREVADDTVLILVIRLLRDLLRILAGAGLSLIELAVGTTAQFSLLGLILGSLHDEAVVIDIDV
jgi:hypothetical protein